MSVYTDEAAATRALYEPVAQEVGLGEVFAFVAARDDAGSRLVMGVLGAVAEYLRDSDYTVEQVSA